MKTVNLKEFLIVSFLAYCKGIELLALNALIQEYFVKHSPKIDLICFGEKTSQSYAKVDEISTNFNGSIVMQMSRGSENMYKSKINSSSLLLFDSIENFKNEVKQITWQTRKDLRNKHLILIHNASKSDIARNLPDAFSIDCVNFLVNANENSSELVTSYAFTSNACKTNQLKIINRFERSIMRWKNSDFYPEKYKNFFGCLLWVGIDKIRGTQAYLNDITKALSVSYNFKFRLKSVDLYNGKADEHKVDLIEDIIGIPDSHFVNGVTYTSEELHFVVPPGELYTPLEKMFLMFELELWIAIIVTIFIIITAIKVINLASLDVQNFVYGRSIRTPMQNLVDIILNGGQNRVPGRNFARFLLIMLIIWSLIIRTCYQSELFKLLQADVRKTPVRSIDEWFEKNFTYYGSDLRFIFPEKGHLM